MSDDELQLRITVERSTQDNAEHVDRSFDMPGPACAPEPKVHRRRKPAIGSVNYGLRRLRGMQVDGNMERLGTLQNPPKEFVVQIAAAVVTIDDGS